MKKVTVGTRKSIYQEGGISPGDVPELQAGREQLVLQQESPPAPILLPIRRHDSELREG